MARNPAGKGSARSAAHTEEWSRPNPQGDAQRPKLARRIHRASRYLPVHRGTQQVRRDPSEAGFCQWRGRKGALAAVGWARAGSELLVAP